jgi:hypothetical protein
MEITTKPLVIMSSGLLVDHSRNTISMDLIVIFIIFIIFPLLTSNEIGHTFSWPSAWNAIIVEWASITHATLFHMQSACKELRVLQLTSCCV